MLKDWTLLTDEQQLALAGEALRRATELTIRQAGLLADEMAEGAVTDRGGPDALRLLAAILTISAEDILPVAGHA